MRPNDLVISQVDIDLFKNIQIDPIFIKIGKNKIRRSNAGTYNQILAYFKTIKSKGVGKDIVFTYWLCDKFNLDGPNELDQDVIGKYEKSLTLNTRSMIYIEALRVMRRNGNIIEFYGIKEDCVLEYLTCTHDPIYTKRLTQYLQFSKSCDDMCQRLNLEHALEKSDNVIKEDIRLCLQHKLIPEVGKIVPLSNTKQTYCLAYYDLTQGNVEAYTPAWDSFIATVPDNGSRQRFRAWVYSVFKGDNFGRQILWLYGRGNTGKSVVNKAISARLAALNQDIVGALPVFFNTDKYTSASFVNKRFIIVPDCINQRLVRDQLIKNVTGNDDMAIRAMHQEAKQANVYSKIMVTSNRKPYVNVELSEELSRILFIALDMKACVAARMTWDSEKMGDWSSCITAEIDNFIAKCAEDYRDCIQEDGHNIEPHPTMEIDIASGDFHIKRDQYTWWDLCIIPYEPKPGGKPHNILTIADLCADFVRFSGKKKGVAGDSIGMIRRFMSTMLINKGIDIKGLAAGNTAYIRDYDFKHKTNKPTLANVVSTEIEKLCYNDDDGESNYGRF